MDLPPYFDLHVFDSVSSTSVVAKELAEAGAAEGSLVWAKQQESGVGRRGRSWSSPEGNLYCSLLLRPECNPLEGACISFLIAVALHQSVSDALPDHNGVRVKWPNDVLIDGKKTCGILLESKTRPDGKLDYLVVGTGVNIKTFPAQTDGLPATSVAAQGGRTSVERMLSSYTHNFLELYMKWKSDGFASIRKDWLSRAIGLGGRITVKLSDRTLEGIFIGLDDSGALILSLDTGETKLITAGEIFIMS